MEAILEVSVVRFKSILHPLAEFGQQLCGAHPQLRAADGRPGGVGSRQRCDSHRQVNHSRVTATKGENYGRTCV